jgi:hypothetical protein
LTDSSWQDIFRLCHQSMGPQMRLLFSATLLLVAVSLTPAASATDAPATAAKKTETKKVCQSYAKVGTLLKRKVCRTQAEWDADTRAAQELMKAPRVESTPGPG